MDSESSARSAQGGVVAVAAVVSRADGATTTCLQNWAPGHCVDSSSLTRGQRHGSRWAGRDLGRHDRNRPGQRYPGRCPGWLRSRSRRTRNRCGPGWSDRHPDCHRTRSRCWRPIRPVRVRVGSWRRPCPWFRRQGRGLPISRAGPAGVRRRRSIPSRPGSARRSPRAGGPRRRARRTAQQGPAGSAGPSVASEDCGAH